MTIVIKSLRSGQITIPADFREKLGIDSATLLQISLMQGELRIKPVKISSEDSRGSLWLKELYDYFEPVRKQIEKTGASEEEINREIDLAVKEVRKQHDKSRL